MHSTGGVIDYDLWMERITAVVLSNAYAENIRCLYENDEMLTKLETGATPLSSKS